MSMAYPAWFDDLKKRYPANQDKVQQAYDFAVRQAHGVGVGADRIDPNYVENLITGTTDKYTSGIIAQGQKNQADMRTLNVLGGTSGGYSPFTYQAGPGLSYEDATTRARSVLQPVYQQDVQDVSRRIGYDLARRGGYGQPDSPEIVMKGIAPTQAAYLSNVGSMANQIHQAAQAVEAQRRSQALGEWQANANLAMNQDAIRRQTAQDAIAAAEAARNWQFQQDQFGYTKQRDTTADQFAREKWDWQKTYDERQLSAANQPKAAEVRTPKQQYEDSIFNKLLTPGMTLTPEEQAYIGKGTGNPWLEAIKMAQGDLRYQGSADPTARKAIVDEYYRLITGSYGGGTGGPTSQGNQNPADWATDGGYYKK